MATLLSNIQDVCIELGLPSPTIAAASTDEGVKQLVALMNRVGNMLATDTNWQALAKEYRFQTVYYTYTGDVTAGSTTITNVSSVTGLTAAPTNFMVTGNGIQQDTFLTAATAGAPNTVTLSMPATATATGVTLTFGQALYAMPSDYARMENKTAYNKSNRWSVVGPKDAQEWQWLKASYVVTGPRMRFRIMGNKFAIWPMPASNLELGFEYVSNGWAQSSTGTLQTKLLADTDVCIFPDQLMILGTKLKYFEIKGFDTTAIAGDMQRELWKWKAAESGADTLSLAPRFANFLLTQNNIPDTGFGNTTT